MVLHALLTDNYLHENDDEHFDHQGPLIRDIQRKIQLPINFLLTCTSNVKYFFKFLIIITRNGNLMPSVFFGSAGHVMYVVLTLVPAISKTSD